MRCIGADPAARPECIGMDPYRRDNKLESVFGELRKRSWRLCLLMTGIVLAATIRGPAACRGVLETQKKINHASFGINKMKLLMFPICLIFSFSFLS